MNLKSDCPEGVSGNWRIQRFEIPDTGTYTRLVRGSHVDRTTVMSDTPAECRHLLPLFSAIGRLKAQSVLLNGLGLGLALRGVLQFKHVQHVDVVEIDGDLIALVWDHVRDARCELTHRNALACRWLPGTRWDVVWHDIRDHNPASDTKADIIRLHRKYGRRCAWQAAWCERYVLKT